MIVYQFCSSVNESNLYFVIDEESREALVIDMPEWCDGLTNAINDNSAKVKGIFITHSHYDHNSGLNYLPTQFKSLPLYPSKKFFQNKNTDNLITLGSYEGRILPLPGHTDDSVGLYFPSAGILFTGDALFAGSVGGTYTETNSQTQLEAIKNQILVLPEDTLVFPGHGPVTSVGIEKKHNPFLK